MCTRGMLDSYQDGRRAAVPQDVKMKTRAGTRARLSCRKPWSAFCPTSLPCLVVGECFPCACKSNMLTGYDDSCG